MPPLTAGTEAGPREDRELEGRIRDLGNQILSLSEEAEAPSLFSKKGLYAALMERAMRDEHFKTQLFRFVDVLPTLNSGSEIARHLKEYLGEE